MLDKQKGEVVVNWLKYPNFFDLYEKEKAKPKIVYVIGESHHCYVGSVGSKGGRGGLAIRYEWQYVERSCAIFGQSKPQNQPAFAGSFIDDTKVDECQIEAAEANVQEAFLKRHGKEAAIFHQKPKSYPDIKVTHQGDAPAFLKLG
mgnify:CR=1 FL=1